MITQSVIRVSTRSQSTKSEVCSNNVHGMCIQADYLRGWAGATEEGVITGLDFFFVLVSKDRVTKSQDVTLLSLQGYFVIKN